LVFKFCAGQEEKGIRDFLNLGEMRTFQFVNLFEYLISFFRNNILEYTRFIKFERSLTNIPRIIPSIKIAVKPASINHIQKICARTFRRRNCERKLAKRLRNGHICFIAEERKKQIVGYFWVAFREIFLSEIGKKMKLSNGNAYLYNAFVFPEFRNKKVFEKMLEEILRFLRKKQFTKAYIGTRASNIPSLRGIRRVGYKPKEVVTLLRVFGLKITLNTDVNA